MNSYAQKRSAEYDKIALCLLCLIHGFVDSGIDALKAVFLICGEKRGAGAYGDRIGHSVDGDHIDSAEKSRDDRVSFPAVRHAVEQHDELVAAEAYA